MERLFIVINISLLLVACSFTVITADGDLVYDDQKPLHEVDIEQKIIDTSEGEEDEE